MGGLISAHAPVYLLMVAVIAIVALLVLLIKLKVHSFVSLILVSLGQRDRDWRYIRASVANHDVWICRYTGIGCFVGRIGRDDWQDAASE